jgi:hypothetical protein
MKNRVKSAILCSLALVCPVQALDIFGRTTREIEFNFLRPLTDIKNTISNTGKIFEHIENPTDRLRVAGGFMKEVSIAVAKLVDFTEFINNKFINSVLSKGAHSKVEEVIVESKEMLTLLQKVADGMREYRMSNNYKEPVLRSSSPVEDTQDTE